MTPVPVVVRRAGEHAVLAEYPDTSTVLQVAAALRELAPPRLREVVPAERTLLLIGTPLSTPGELEGLLAGLSVRPLDLTGGTEVVIPVVYDGDDLEDVADLLGHSPGALIDAHTATAWTAAFGGFAPGFAYLIPGDGPTSGPPGRGGAAGTERTDRTSGDLVWDVPRRAEPRTTVPAGSVALASRYSGIYPRPSPGGWQLIGRTEAVLFDPGRRQPALLTPGTRVRFEARRGRVSASSVGRIAAAIRPRTGGSVRVPHRAGSSAPRPALTVTAPGPLLLVQDGGRPEHAAIGVSRSGAFDRGALVQTNRAVGNAPFAPALELLVGPMRLRAEAPTVVAVAGAPTPITVTRHDAETGHLELSPEAGRGRAIALDPGDLVEIGPVVRGLRVILAVRGGVVVHRELGSASRDTLSALGPEPLAIGDTVHVGPEHGLDAVPWHGTGAVDGHTADEPDGDAGGAGPTGPQPCPTGSQPSPAEVPIALGPRHTELGEGAVAALLGQDWTVRADSDRIGVRLEGAPLPVPDGAGALPSEPMVPGAIQVPPSGLPVVFGPDGPATGGYPVIGVLSEGGLDLLAQAAPGSTLRFTDAARRRA